MTSSLNSYSRCRVRCTSGGPFMYLRSTSRVPGAVLRRSWPASRSPGLAPACGDGSAAGRRPCRPGRVPARLSLCGAGRGLRAVGGVAGGVRSGCGGGGGEPVAARLVGGQLGDPEADELVQGVGDRAGGPGQYLADLVRGEDRAGELAQCSSTRSRSPPGRVAGACCRWRRPSGPASPGRPAPARFPWRPGPPAGPRPRGPSRPRRRPERPPGHSGRPRR
jgi:hypothetical protein